jgi:hypothetical protein
VVLRPLFSPLGTSLRDTLSGNTWQKGTVENTNRGARPLSADCFAIACRAMGGCRVTAISASSLITTSRRSVTTSTIRRANVSDGRRQQKHSEKTCWRKWVDHPTLKSNSGRSSGIAHIPQDMLVAALQNQDMKSVCDRLDVTPRKCLDWRTPIEASVEELRKLA